MSTSSAPSRSEPITQEVIDQVDCPTCDSEAGYGCTYIPPKVQHKAYSSARRRLLKRVGTATKKPHLERYQAYWRLKEREAQQRHRQELAQQRKAREEKLREAHRKQNELRLAYQEYGRRESAELTAWLRENWRIFRIDEVF